jgi:imidazolonepropionase-like amidohydrolase
LLALPLASSAAAAAPPPAPPLLLTGAKVLAPTGDHWLEGMDALVRDGHIARIAPSGRIEAPAGARRIDLAGDYLIPGLMDLHTHLLLHPYDETPWDDQVLRESLELRTIQGVTHAKATVDAGFTTIRDLGTEGAGYADVALRDAIAQGVIPGPRVLAATRAIVATASYGPMGFDPRLDLPLGGQQATGVDQIRRVVREQIHHGADWIKLYADYRRAPGAPSTATFTVEEMRAAVEEAKRAAHATTPEGIRRAIEAGVTTIEHATGATRELLDRMAAKGIAMDPTLAASEAIARYGGWHPGEPEPERMQQDRRMFHDALASGVTIFLGSDAGVFAHGDNARELELMVDYGMTPTQALTAATSVAAGVIGRGDDLGKIDTGYTADLVALAADPLAAPSAVRHPLLVLEEGRVMADRREAR